MVNVLFVCLGNICRSPTAHGVFEKKVAEAGLSDVITIDSCGTGSWHIGHEPDDRTVQAAADRGYNLSHLRARKLVAEDFVRYDYILAMDARNLADVIKKAPSDFSGQLQLLLDYSPITTMTEVPDPYYGGSDGFERVFDLVESACDGLLAHIQQRLAAD